MLIGYGRVSTSDQNPSHQIDALRRAGVAADDIHIDTASGAKASRPKLDLALKLARDGDTLVITRLDRLGRSLLHLVQLGDQLKQRGVGLKVLEQGVDTSTSEGRAMFGMLAVLAEFQRDLIIANTRDGLEAARARGRKGGRKPKLTATQVEQAQRLYDEGNHTAAQIAEILGVKRGTLYGHLNKETVGARPRARKPATSSARGPTHPGPLVLRCPSCGYAPSDRSRRWQQRQDLGVMWLSLDKQGDITQQRHCANCQPREDVQLIDCPICGDGPILTGTLASQPSTAHQWLLDHGWHDDTAHGLICAAHRE